MPLTYYSCCINFTVCFLTSYSFSKHLALNPDKQTEVLFYCLKVSKLLLRQILLESHKIRGLIIEIKGDLYLHLRG